jgi:hypothetical protein
MEASDAVPASRRTPRHTGVPGLVVWRATADASSSTPAGRDRVVDLLRIGSLLVVVLGHMVMVVPRWHGDHVRLANLLAEVRELQILTWVLQVMPVFFAAGAIANRVSWRAAAARGDSWSQWLWHRLVRLARPTAWYLAIWVPIVWVLAWAMPESASTLARLSTQLLWFLGAYVLVIATTRWQVRLAVVGYPAVVALLLAIAAVDLARFADVPLVALTNFVLVWFMAAVLGLVVRDRVGRGRRQFILCASGALAVDVVLIATTRYPLSMVGMPGEPMSNMAPPTLVLALHTVVLLSFVGLAWPTLERWCASGRVWRVVAAFGAAAMTIYLWHLTALVGVVALEHALRFTRGTVDEPRFWITLPVHLLVAAAASVLLIMFAVAFEHRPLPWVERPGVRARSGTWWTVLAVVGVATVGCGLLALAATGMGGFPFERTTEYHGLPLTPGFGVLLLVAGVLAVRAAGRPVVATSKGPQALSRRPSGEER